LHLSLGKLNGWCDIADAKPGGQTAWYYMVNIKSVRSVAFGASTLRGVRNKQSSTARSLVWVQNSYIAHIRFDATTGENFSFPTTSTFSRPKFATTWPGNRCTVLGHHINNICIDTGALRALLTSLGIFPREIFHTYTWGATHPATHTHTHARTHGNVSLNLSWEEYKCHARSVSSLCQVYNHHT
jgi:hypothetical protein